MKNQFFIFLLAFSFFYGISFVGCGTCSCGEDDGETYGYDSPCNYNEADNYSPDIDEAPDFDTDCVIEDTIVTPNPDYPAYFAVKAYGTINDGKLTSNPTAAFTSEFAVKLEKHPTHTLKSSYIFYQDAILKDETPAVTLIALGDPLTKWYGTVIIVTLSNADLMAVKESGITDIVSGVQTQVSTIEEINGGAIAKICTVGYTDIDDSNNAYAGKSKICTDNNVKFAFGEKMNFGTNVKINEDIAFIMQMLNVTTEAELCQCLDAATNAVVECPATINDNDTTTDNKITTDETPTTDETVTPDE